MMPPNRVEIADSEDDEEEVICGSQEGRQNRRGDDGIGNCVTVDSDTPSTGSTAQLKAEVLSAQRRLMQSSSTEDSTLQTAAVQRAKRRTTGPDELKTDVGSNKAKRIKTYDGKLSSCDFASETAFAALHADHSQDMFAGGPGGSLHFDFEGHNPQMLFRDSGSSTVEDMPSQVPMTEMQLPVAKTPEQSGKSSSFPWTLSEPTQATHVETQTHKATSLSHKSGDAADLVAGNNVLHDCSVVDELSTLKANPTPAEGQEYTISRGNEVTAPTVDAGMRQQSPFVEIVSRKRRSSVQDADPSPKPPPNRAQKAHQEKQELHSDEAIGLPAEQYKPRPSRRRATQIADAQIDYSVRPERTAKRNTKRRRTDSDATGVLDSSLGQIGASVADAHDSSNFDPNYIKAASKVTTCTTASPPSISGVEIDQPAKVQGNEVATKGKIRETRPVGDQVIVADSSPRLVLSQEKKLDKDGFAVPSPLPKMKARARRHHTTIFEDHPNFEAAEKAPSLKQQQEKRKRSLKEASKKSSDGRRSRSGSLAQSDDEDELAKSSVDEIAIFAPLESDNVSTAVPAKKRKSGRLLKTQPEIQSEKTIDTANSESKDQTTHSEDDITGDGVVGMGGRETAHISKDVTIHSEDYFEADDQNKPPPSTPTDIPHQQGQEKVSPLTKQLSCTISNPTVTHSPLKSSSSVPLRVGLSKRQRIPSLLRIKPVPPKRKA